MKVCLQTQILQINAIKPNGIDDDLAQGFHVLLVYISTDNAVLEIEVRRRNDNADAICCSKGLVVTLPVVERIFAPGVTIVQFCREFLHVLGWLTVFLFVGVNHIIVLALYLSLAVSGLNHCLYHGDSLEFGVRIDLDHHFWSSHEVTDEDYSVGRDINLFGTLLDQFLAVARLVYESVLIIFSKNTQSSSFLSFSIEGRSLLYSHILSLVALSFSRRQGWVASYSRADIISFQT